MNLLHIDSGILADHSVSRKLTASIADRLKAAHSDLSVVYRDLAAAPLAHLNGGHLMAAGADPATLDAAMGADVVTAKSVMAEFMAADVIVIGAPMYNFSIPSQLKAWFDRILIAGVTFHYTETGPKGLVTGKKVIVASTRGGAYAAGTPASVMDHQETLISALLGFIGITDIEFIRAEGMAYGPEAKDAAIAQAEQSIASLAVAA